MGTNLLAPNGLSLSRNFLGSSPTYQGSVQTIKRGYATAIGKGDLVKTQNVGSGSQGYVGLSLIGDTGALGVFLGLVGYYDLNATAFVYGLVGSYPATALPPVGVDVQCYVASDPFATFIAQVSGGPFAQSWVGQNINFTAATNGAPNISGTSTLSLDGSSVGVAPAPFRIIGVVGMLGGPQDPTNTNPWIEVKLNTSEVLSTAGI